MESVFFKNMPEANVNRTNRKTKKNKDSEETLAETFPSGFFFFFVFFGCFLFFFFFVFLLNCAKSFVVELWADKRMQKVDLGGGRAYIYIICIYRIYVSQLTSC